MITELALDDISQSSLRDAYDLLSERPYRLHAPGTSPARLPASRALQQQLHARLLAFAARHPSRLVDAVGPLKRARRHAAQHAALFDLDDGLARELARCDAAYPPECRVKRESRTPDGVTLPRSSPGKRSSPDRIADAPKRPRPHAWPRRPSAVAGNGVASTAAGIAGLALDSPAKRPVAAGRSRSPSASPTKAGSQAAPLGRPPAGPAGASLGGRLQQLPTSLVSSNSRVQSDDAGQPTPSVTSETCVSSRTTSFETTTSAGSTAFDVSADFPVLLTGDKPSRFLAGAPLDESERYIAVTPPNPYQRFLRDVQFGVQWELERLVAQHGLDWADFTLDDFQALRGDAVVAGPAVCAVVAGVAARQAVLATVGPLEADHDRPVWAQIDYEAGRRVGTIEDYGGKVAYTVAVLPTGGPGIDPMAVAPPPESQPNVYRTRSKQAPAPPPPRDPEQRAPAFPYRLELRPADVPGKSTRLARRFGSDSVVHFRISGALGGKARALLLLFFRGRCFVLFRRVYRGPWAPPEGGGVIAVHCKEDVPHPLGAADAGSEMPTFMGYLERYNDLLRKPGQAMAKWAARPQLLFSDSVPATTVCSGRVKMFEPDIVSDCAQGQATTEQILTDGCGLMSEELARQIHLHPSINRNGGRPCAVQMRLGGAKGLLAVMSAAETARYAGYDVVLRGSMIKSLPAAAHAADPSLWTLDVVRAHAMRLGARLSSEPMIIMQHGGVRVQVFLDKVSEGLDEVVRACWPAQREGEGEGDMLARLAGAVYRHGGLAAGRKRRALSALGGSLKVAGLSNGWGNDDDDNDDDDAEGADASDPAALSLAETLCRAISAGFSPLNSLTVALKLRTLVDLVSADMVRRFKLDVAESASAFIVPDTSGVLGPDEISVVFSDDAPVDPVSGQGDVLVYRSPCKLPTDVRKMRAVARPELFHLEDCIVMSAAPGCVRSPASFLGGGDYDGDTVTVIWDKAIVEPFTNAPDHLADAPASFEADNFVRQMTTGTDFLGAIEGQGTETVIANYQRFLLDGVASDGLAGRYSEMHAAAVYRFGLDDPQALRLARMFCLVLDARKSGLRVEPRVLSADSRRHGYEVEWLRYKKDRDRDEDGQRAVARNVPRAERPARLGEFVMDELMAHGKARRARLLSHFPASPIIDRAVTRALVARLSQPYLALRRIADVSPSVADELAAVDTHVSACLDIWDRVNQGRIPAHTSVRDVYEAARAHGRVADDMPAQRDADPRRRAALLAQLREVWRAEPAGLDVLDLQALREVRVARAFAEAKDDRAVLDLDLETAAVMVARTGGAGAVAVRADVYTGMKVPYAAAP